MNTSPIHTSCMLDETLSRLRLLRITPMRSTPATVRGIEPRPPNRLVPPSTTAATANSSVSWAALGWPDSTRPSSVNPASTTATPPARNTPRRTRVTWTPARRAASALPPTA